VNRLRFILPPLLVGLVLLALALAPPAQPAMAEDFSDCLQVTQGAGTTYQYTLPAGAGVWLSATGARRVALVDVYIVELDSHEPDSTMLPGTYAQPFMPYANSSQYTYVLTFDFNQESTLSICGSDPYSPPDTPTPTSTDTPTATQTTTSTNTLESPFDQCEEFDSQTVSGFSIDRSGIVWNEADILARNPAALDGDNRITSDCSMWGSSWFGLTTCGGRAENIMTYEADWSEYEVTITDGAGGNSDVLVYYHVDGDPTLRHKYIFENLGTPPFTFPDGTNRILSHSGGSAPTHPYTLRFCPPESVPTATPTDTATPDPNAPSTNTPTDAPTITNTPTDAPALLTPTPSSGVPTYTPEPGSEPPTDPFPAPDACFIVEGDSTIGAEYVGSFPPPFVRDENFLNRLVYYLGGERMHWTFENLAAHEVTLYVQSGSYESWWGIPGGGSRMMGAIEWAGLSSPSGAFQVRVCPSGNARATGTATAQTAAAATGTAATGTAAAGTSTAATGTAAAGTSTAATGTAAAATGTATAQRGHDDGTATARIGDLTRTPATGYTPAPWMTSESGGGCCTPVPQKRYATLGTVPDLGIVVPTFAPLPVLTSTMVISMPVDVVSTTLHTTMDAMETPHTAIMSATADYSWERGMQTAAEWGVYIEPAVSWLAVVNPQHAAWTEPGSPLWALAPILLPLAPALLVGLLVVLSRYWLFFAEWFRRIIDMVIKLIEMIPGM
jgi:hypothetical protein